VRELALAFRALRLTPATSFAVILSLSFWPWCQYGSVFDY
jgi:hypothetical protein